MSPEADDEQVTRWAHRAGRGDQQAAAAFVRALQGPVWRFLAHLAGPAEADDLTQETFLRALRGLPGFAGRSAARTWVFTIARRVAVDHVRAATARPRVAALPDWQAAQVCGCPVGTIRSRVARAREDLVAAWQDDARGGRVV
ncbi:ECF RNA polymerase sigma factor SigC [Micromonospora sp. MH33]|uniref:sigma factor n=1 Tax=Micromonospora sp. MH33 TaxID=1945509 RepID=UPI000D14B5EA|nr:sigma factor [Micromonospora sp. MH33]PSK61227.1 ECF RNA polymerase sigma factor SigC [Micromonospora sp. MH33]